MERPNNSTAKILVRRTRGGDVETVHRGWAVFWNNGEVHSAGDPGTPVFTRSCTKPFQALACVASGAADYYKLSEEELSLACASHNGSEEHAKLANGMLAKAGLREEHLLCGKSEPFGSAERKLFLQKNGQAAPPIHNCSGKHAAFLLTQLYLGGKPEDYLKPDSAVQTFARKLVSEVLETPAEQLGNYVDGCSAPTFRPSMRAIAHGFAKLANPELTSAVLAPHLARLRDAIANVPWAHSGAGRLCHTIIEASGGNVIPKNGAEGLYVFGVRNKKAAFAVKTEDGADRGYEAVVADALIRHGWVDSTGAAKLQKFADLNIYNSAKIVVGRQEIVEKL